MKYIIAKMMFPQGIHVGDGNLTDSQSVFMADTLYSALCLEAIRYGVLSKWHDWCKSGQIHLSDGMPYVGETYYIPKPMMKIQTEEQGSSILKKAFKKLKYIPVEKLTLYLDGKLNPLEELDYFSNFGKKVVREQAVIKGEDDTLPYGIGAFSYGKRSGLYVLLSVETQEQELLVKELMTALSYSGIGGKKSSGYGRFTVEYLSPSHTYEKILTKKGVTKWMSLAISMAKDEELDSACNEEATYQLVKRSGFTDSYGENTARKKQDFYGFVAGSCFTFPFEGDIVDVSSGHSHPVYKYAMPLWIGVEGCETA